MPRESRWPAADHVDRVKRRISPVNIFLPVDSSIDPRVVALIATIPQALTIALAALVFRVSHVGRSFSSAMKAQP
jgi:hypothetical protein